MGTNKGPLIGSEQQIKATKANSIGRTVYRFLLQVNPPRLTNFPSPTHILSLCTLARVVLCPNHPQIDSSQCSGIRDTAEL